MSRKEKHQLAHYFKRIKRVILFMMKNEIVLWSIQFFKISWFRYSKNYALEDISFTSTEIDSDFIYLKNRINFNKNKTKKQTF